MFSVSQAKSVAAGEKPRAVVTGHSRGPQTGSCGSRQSRLSVKSPPGIRREQSVNDSLPNTGTARFHRAKGTKNQQIATRVNLLIGDSWFESRLRFRSAVQHRPPQPAGAVMSHSEALSRLTVGQEERHVQMGTAARDRQVRAGMELRGELQPRWGRHAGTGQIIGVPDFRMDAELTCAAVAGRVVTPAAASIPRS